MLLPATCERKYWSEVVSARLGKEKGGLKANLTCPDLFHTVVNPAHCLDLRPVDIFSFLE